MSALCWTGTLPVEIWQITLHSAAAFFKIMCPLHGGKSFTIYKSDRINGLKSSEWSLCESMLHFFAWFKRDGFKVCKKKQRPNTFCNIDFIYKMKVSHKREVKWKTESSGSSLEKVEHTLFHSLHKQTAPKYLTYRRKACIKLREQMCLWEMGCLINLWHNVIELVGT